MIIDDLEAYIEVLKRQSGDEVFKIRRKLEDIRATYLKHGNALAITKPFVLSCYECGSTMQRPDDYYLHLRKQHQYEDAEASKETLRSRKEYETAIHQLETLLTEFTDYYLEEPNHGFTGRAEDS